MRLIDADKFQRDLTSVWKWLVERDTAGYGTTHGEMLDKVHDILSTQPTAYDVDKVVEELEEITKNYVRYNPPMNDYENGFEVGVEAMADRAIDILKESVKNEH